MAIKSLRLRIQIWHAAILTLVIVGFASAAYWQQSRWRMREIDRELSSAVEVLSSQLAAMPVDILANIGSGEQPDPTNKTIASEIWESLRVPDTFTPRRIRHRFEAPYFAIIATDGRVLKSSTHAFERIPPAVDYPPQDASSDITYRFQGEWREAFVQGPADSIVLAGRYLGTDFRDLQELAWILSGIGLLLLGVGLLGGWLASGRAVAPIGQIAIVAERISASQLSDRVNAESMDREFAGLANTLNQTFERLEAAFQRQSQFTSDASHELRTPLSVMNMHQQLALSKPRSESDYRETIEVCQRATRRMTDLVESLLTLARLDANMQPNFTTIEITETVLGVIEELKPLATKRALLLEHALEQSIHVHGDATQLAQVIRNVLGNAISHSPIGETIQITLTADGDFAHIHIVDHGPGIASEHLGKIFDRFYRIEQDRSRSDSGGSGLGLSISHSIVRLHQGTITVRSEPGQGSDFEIRLPLTKPETPAPTIPPFPRENGG
ncbi:sensor histidine kinase [Aporhodopirellula aestuarii]|uniref:histidine kinase n=1 Tax=Aporhodopirellula aestuarii TaxID=2950107 RepID=A0ABT0UBS3_9BACT|nr:ATP-binding protein [Aporhodopirellula aestuarii]MCM2374311.1 ATP-binding protein [Aporhodopirellula aestuarii]